MNNRITRIKFSNVIKTYSLHKRAFGSLRNFFVEMTRKDRDKFTALDNVSFEIFEGENVGIVGVNGSGKSTSLKIMAGVTNPSSGSVEINGKIAAMIQVGAGFHPELTGLENVYLNGAILGLSKNEIQNKLQSIIDFAELEGFMQTPVKYYSSGMYMRLGFAVAVHVDADILLIDEVLAVGDLSFQRKCLTHMNKLKQAGKTIIFVSHNIYQVESLCERAIWLDKGKVMMDGPSKDVISAYVKEVGARSANIKEGDTDVDQTGTGEAYFNSIHITGDETNKSVESGAEVEMVFEVTAKAEATGFKLFLGFTNDEGVNVGGHLKQIDLQSGKNIFRAKIDTRNLLPGSYVVKSVIYNKDTDIRTPVTFVGEAGRFLIESPHNIESNKQLFGVTKMNIEWNEK